MLPTKKQREKERNRPKTIPHSPYWGRGNKNYRTAQQCTISVLPPIYTEIDIAANGRRIAVELKAGFPMVDDGGQNTPDKLFVLPGGVSH